MSKSEDRGVRKKEATYEVEKSVSGSWGSRKINRKGKRIGRLYQGRSYGCHIQVRGRGGNYKERGFVERTLWFALSLEG